jgi:endonuclease YncB( thermonuclease family)
MIKILQEMDDAPLFSLQNQKLPCKVKSVYDGDTLTVIFPFNNSYYKSNLRLLGIDTPEIKTKNLSEKQAGLLAKEWLTKKIQDKIIYVAFEKEDKYGRLLGVIYEKPGMNDFKHSINQMLIDENLAITYNGGKKQTFHD